MTTTHHLPLPASAAVRQRPGSRKPLLAAVGAACLFLACSAQAAPITFTGSGNLTMVQAGVSPTFSVGQAFNFSMTYESSTPNNIGPTYGNYSNPLVAFSGTVGSYSFSWTNTSGSTINIPQNYGMDVIIYNGSGWSGAPVQGKALNFGNIFFTDPDGGGPAYNNVGLPTSAPPYGPTSYFRLGFSGSEIRGTLSSVTVATPEPAEWVLFGSALVACAALRRRTNARG